MGYQDMKEMFNDARDFAEGANNYQLKSILSEIQLKVYDLQKENNDLRNEIHDLKNIDIIESQLTRDGDFLYKEKGTEPYCMRCWDVDKKLIRAVQGEVYYVQLCQCPECKFKSDKFKKTDS